ncbi:RNA pseudouridine synthase 7 [Gracilariopsis chorda]|uniref:RNA pseudouridine synthase 7 n=1 Tax=Gracilariopsis chorda TaxID=448386 RepID=A0A2V3INC0_9FLOR|nr:RNA pseudouridine synthase 7 [Gracilariopsis chorda]|eukprot:PXF43578.1 RNA pseudouridine synthase 7 [Gracilariopsis chorda]
MFFEFRTYYKPRWKNKTVYETFCDEFSHKDEVYWSREFDGGRILCKGQTLGINTAWYDGMEVIHIVHRHESAVLSERIHIAVDREGFVVVSKPPSVPVHPCGTYRRNCLQFILKAFYGMGDLFSVHRLDKETSGLVIMAKNPEYAARFAKEIKDHKVRKTYIAEVNGIFPNGELDCKEPIYWDKKTMKAGISEKGADATTKFSKISHNNRECTSLVECKPITGRTHQIRVHLAHLGYAIINDTLYATERIPSKRSKVSRDFESSALLLTHDSFKDEAAINMMRKTYLACEWSRRSYQQHGRHLTCTEEGEELCCKNCPQVTNDKNVNIDAMYIHLHALKYESSEWSFEVPRPEWALDTKNESRVRQDANKKRSAKLSHLLDEAWLIPGTLMILPLIHPSCCSHRKRACIVTELLPCPTNYQ